MRYIKPDKLSESEVGKWAHLDFGRRSFALHFESRYLDKVTVDIDGKKVVFLENRVDDGFNNWFKDQYLESEETFDRLKLRWTKNKLLSVTDASITVEAYFDYFTPNGIPFLDRSFTKTLSFPKSDLAEVLIYASESNKDPQSISMVASSTKGSIRLQFWDMICNQGVKGVDVMGTGPTTLKKSRTDSDGIIEFENLKPGTYSINAAKNGFKKVEIVNLVVELGMEYRSTFGIDHNRSNPQHQPCGQIEKP